MRSTVASFVFAVAFSMTAHAASPPVVYWASDPIRPGETVLVTGENLGNKPVVELMRLEDASIGVPAEKAFVWRGKSQKVEALESGEHSLKFVVPSSLRPGLFAYRIAGPGGAAVGLLNRPVIWWAQGDIGVTASPGGWVRSFGKNLLRPERKKGKDDETGRFAVTTLWLRGPKDFRLVADADCYSAKVKLPEDLPVGRYKVSIHNGCGGSEGWSDPATITIERRRPWPQMVFNVRDFGADGTGEKDDTAAVRMALAKAQMKGGGVVYFPRGRYQVTGSLSIPRFTVLRGEKEEWVNVFWPDMKEPPNALLAGTDSFGLENLTLYCSNYKTFLASDTRGENAGDVFLRHVRIRANIYRGHMEAAEVDRRYRAGLSVGFGGGYWLVVLGGKNVEVTDCDLYSSSCVLSLTEPRGARIERNVLGSGRWGGSGVFGGDGIIISDNRYVGCDLMSWGAAGGLGYGNLLHIYMGHNSFSLQHGGDREPITSDASGGLYNGKISTSDSTSVTLPAAPKGATSPWIGAAVSVVSGKGAGQWREVAGFEGSKILINRAWDVMPDTSSIVVITFLLHQWLIVDNDFSDTGMAVQLYGAALEHIVANNRSTRTAGYHNFGMNYNGVQPSWYVQWLDNEILEGNIYNADHDNWRLSGDAHIGVYGLIGPEWHYPITLGTVIRRNHLRNNAGIVLGSELGSVTPIPTGRADPLVTDVIVEKNSIENSDVGVYLFQTTRGALMRDNQFRNVKQPLWDEAVTIKANEARRQKFLGSAAPIAVWDFDNAVVDEAGLVTRVPDATGNRFDATGPGVRLVNNGIKGQAARFSGESFLRVDDPAMFNLQSVTLSLWIKPDTIKGRHGLIGKRFAGTVAPFVLSLWEGGLEFEATDERGQWSFNFRSQAAVKEGEWSHVVAVVEEGKGATLYCNGQVVGRKESPVSRMVNAEPLVIGREAWAGVNMVHEPCYYHGLMDEVKVWARALTEDEVKAEFGKGNQGK